MRYGLVGNTIMYGGAAVLFGYLCKFLSFFNLIVFKFGS